MAWSYNETLAFDRDKVRMLIGDVDRADQQLQDEALDWHLSEEGGVYAAAAAAARSVAALYARRVDFTQSAASLMASQRQAHYTALADKLAARARSGAIASVNAIGAPTVGGLSESEIDATRTDTDLVQPRVTHDLHDAPGTATPFRDAAR